LVIRQLFEPEVLAEGACFPTYRPQFLIKFADFLVWSWSFRRAVALYHGRARGDYSQVPRLRGLL